MALERHKFMTRNALYWVAGLLAAAVLVIGYLYYDQQQRSGISIEIGDQGLTVEGT